MGKLAKALKIVWRLIVGGVLAYFGYQQVQPQLGSVQVTAAATLGIALIAVGASILAGAFD